jgi:transposase
MVPVCYFLVMPRLASPVCLTETNRLELERWVAAHHTPQQVSQRCQIVLAASRGQTDNDIASDLEINFKTAALWRKRFIDEGADSLWEVAQGRGRKPTLTPQAIERIVDATLQTKPAGSTHWSCRTMAKAQGVSKATVNRIWQSYQIKPHRIKRFKLSRDPNFLQKLTDVVGLYLNPPQKALVLCVDEKSQIQALDRAQP